MSTSSSHSSDDRPILELKQVGQDYGYQKVLQNLDLTLLRGELVCLQGPNGAGKSTLLKCLTARRGPDHGELYYKNILLKDYDVFNRYLGEIAYLGHATGLLLDLSARENLNYICGLHFRQGMQVLDPPDLVDSEKFTKPAAAWDAIDCWLLHVGLYARRNDPVRIFSRGMQQRLALARVFMLQPTLLFLDEPLTGLDLEGSRLLINLLKRYKMKGGTALYVTHDEAAFGSLTERYIFFNNGFLVADIPAARYTANARKHVQQLLYS